MSKRLAIKGHSTRGKEVIEILEMMGGNTFNSCMKIAYLNRVYYIGSNNAITWDFIGPEEIDKYTIFTLEEFLKKYPFKVGDKVMDGHGNLLTIKSMSWSEDCETMVYDFEETEDVLCAEDLLKWTEKEGMEEKKINQMSLANCDLDEVEIVLGDKFELKIKDGKYYAVRKKPKYPDNYEECVRIAKNIHGYDIHIDTPTYRELMESFVKLLICRDAYWKIAGEEMGLGKPWEPDWNDESQKYCIRMDRNKIVNCSSSFNNRILAFPTEEMRDTFYKNFKDLIEQCKELL